MTSKNSRLDRQLPLASEHANGLTSYLSRARGLARMMARQVDTSSDAAEVRAHALASDLASARRIASNLGLLVGDVGGDLLGYSRDFANEIVDARVLGRELGFAGTPALILSSYLDRARDLTSDLIDAVDARADLAACAIAKELYRGLAEDSGFADIRALAIALAKPSARVFPSASTAVDDPIGAPEQPKAKWFAPSAASLLAASTRLLPPSDRARYAEEYLGELWDLAQSGAGRSQQLRYASCQLISALPTGFALRSPHRRSASP